MFRNLVLTLALLLPLSACASKQIKRIDANETIDLSGKWNDTDSRLVAEEMIKDCLSQRWLDKARAESPGKIPTVIVGSVKNQSHEHIATDTFIEDLQRSLINSGEISFVASKGERGDLREERLEQDANATEDTRKATGQEIGADYMLSGAINTIEDKEDNEAIMLYQTNLKLVNVKTNQIVWNGQKKIKKYMKRDKASW